ncbi:complement factor H-related protein 1-like [Genypterus blacodes]|uniref:complement factor H-related protein 1-like n=1 Tax=Genypterus blacodes TaxID=154954 RepID=UPI003F75DDB7
MSFKCLRFVLLIWFPGALHAQSTSPCEAPDLDDGYFVPVQVSYLHGTKLYYACDRGHKPAVEGWWGTSTCENGEWSHKLECIEEEYCLLQNIPHAKFSKTPKRWYKDGRRIRVECEEGYIHKDHDATAECKNGTWLSVPVCERDDAACGEPPKLPHAVIIHRSMQGLFAANSEVLYECEDEYGVEGTVKQQSLFCIMGEWSEGQPCRRESRPTSRHDRHPTTGGGAGTTGGGPSRPGGSGTLGGGVSTGSGHNERETGRTTTAITRCGERPRVPNGDIVETTETYLRYQCITYYKLWGPEIVMCHSGTWSTLPSCTEAFCVVDSDSNPFLKPFLGVKHLKEGQKTKLECLKLSHQWFQHFTVVKCSHGQLSFTDCCVAASHHFNTC